MVRFNRGSFNRVKVAVHSLSGNGHIKLKNEVDSFTVVTNFEGISDFRLGNKTYMLTVVANFMASNMLNLKVQGMLNATSFFTTTSGILLFSAVDMVRIRNPAEIFYFKPNAQFNKMSFNRSRFSTKKHENTQVKLKLTTIGNLVSVITFDGDSTLNMFADTEKLNIVGSFTGNSHIEIISAAYIIAIRNLEGISYLKLTSRGYINIIRSLEGDTYIVLLSNSEEFFTFRLESIDLTNLVLRVGEELVINTDEKTVMVNGINVMRYLHRNSEFFNFNPNENEVTFLSGNNNNLVQLRLLWKDAWL